MPTIRDFPGIEVEERPWNGSQDSRAFAAEQGPGNARVPPGGSPEAQFWQGERAAADMGPPRPPGVDMRSGNPVFNAGRVAAQTTGNAIKTAGGFIEDAGRAAAGYVKPVLGATLKYGADASHVLPHANFYGSDAPFTDKLRVGASDALQFATTGAGATFGAGAGSVALPGAGTVAGGFAGGIAGSKAGEWAGNKMFDRDEALRRNGFDPNRNVIDFGKDLIEGKGWNVAAGGNGGNVDQANAQEHARRVQLATAQQPEPAFSTVEPAWSVRPPPLNNSVLPGAGAGRGRINPPLATASERPDLESGPYLPGAVGSAAGTAVRGVDGVRKFKTADGRTLYSNVAGNNTADMRSGPISDQNFAAADALASRYASQGQARGGLRAGMPDEPNLPAGYGANIPGVTSPASQWQTELNARNAGVRSSLIPPEVSGREVARLANQKEIAADQNATTRRGQDINADVTREGHKVNMRGQDLNYGATTRGQDLTYGATTRGQNLTYDASVYGHELSARTAAAQARMEQFNKDRTYELDKAEKNRAASIANDEAMRKDLETRFRTTDAKGNDVPDHGKIAAFSTATNSTIPRMIEALEAKGTPEAVAKAKALRERGSAALEKGDIDGLHQLFDRRERMRDARGRGPNQGTFSESDNLLDYKQTGVEPRFFGGNRVVTPAGSVSINDLRYTEPANSFIPDFFKIENRNLTRGVRSE